MVGRSGSGKSTLMAALLRLAEVDSDDVSSEGCSGDPGGSIAVDGVDVRAVPLHVLRSRIGILPQDPTLFR